MSRAAPKKLKMWTGNLDGRRRGLVIAPTKKQAREIVGGGVTDFNRYWKEDHRVIEGLEPLALYTQPYDAVNSWVPGRCVLPNRRNP